MKKFYSAVLTAVLSLGMVGVVAGSASAGTKLRIGASPTPHAEILQVANEVLKPQGYEIQVVEYSDYVQPNMALESKELDANFFQHKPYLDDFNKEKGTSLFSMAAVHYEPFGIYAGRTSSLEGLKNGAITATRRDVIDNPKKLKIEELEAAQLVRALPDVDIAIINGNYAILGGLKVKDALAAERADSVAATTYANILAIRKGDEERADLQALVNALKSEAVKKFMESKYEGAVVPAQ